MQLENQNLNIPNLTVSELVERLGDLYESVIRAGLPVTSVPTPFLWGPAGVGKSDGVRQLAALLQTRTGKTVKVTDIRLLLFSPVDLRGVPVADEHRKFTDWLKPRIFDMDPGQGTLNLLFLDELSAAPQSVQAAAYQITLDRRVGEHELPDNCIVIAAGNRTTDQSVSYKMPKALCNRLMHFNIQTDFEPWKRWAQKEGLDGRVVGYLSFDRSRLCHTPESSDLAYPTPRSWAFVSRILSAMGPDADLESLRPLIAGCVGTDTSVEFVSWCKVCAKMPDVNAILRGVCTDYPKSQDVLYALTASLVAAVRMKGENLLNSELEHVCAYALRFPPDFAETLFTDLEALPGLTLQLMKCPSMSTWIQKRRKSGKGA